MKKTDYFDAVMNLVGGILSGPRKGPISEFHFDNNSTAGVKAGFSLPTEQEIQTELAKLRAAEPLRLLRIERDRLLAESDWWASSDLTMSAKRKSYRQALRDLPASASPSLDESGQLTGVTWPTKP